MATDHRAQLAQIRTFPSLIRYLRDEMSWPIVIDDFEALTFDYTPDELGIEAASAAKIQEIKRLRPLSPSQPWGIFFVKFEPKRLPVVALRRILSRVVLKKRSSANSAERAAWAPDDLLFVSNFGEGDERQISFAHFSQHDGKDDLPTLKVLGWDNLDTPLHLEHVADLLTERLAWPDNEKDVARWRESWRSAFTLRHREVINTSKALAVRLAELARAIHHRIKTVLAIETERGPVTRLMTAFKEALVHDLDADGFADMYAQTIAYGLLSARVTNPKANTADGFAVQLPVTNPFLKELMEAFLHVGGRKGKAGSGHGLDFDELGVSEVVELLDDANMEAVVRDFGDRNPEEDPVIHFYELFLKEYDAKRRMQRGVFYTPRPVVSYIVRSVHEIMQTEFGLTDGLADTATWGQMAKRNVGLTLPEGVKAGDRFVTILDPATGTGTFLVEAIEVIRRTLVEKWTREGHGQRKILDLWNEYIPKHLLPRLHGYELLMAPYAIAHLKIGLKLHETGYRFESDQRARIYLTNALEPAHDFSGTLAFAIPALAHEAEAVNAVKRHQCFTVVVGNPPYAKSSANRSDAAEALVSRYKKLVDGETNVQPLSDDYVKFLAYAISVSVPACSILGMITNRSYLGGLLHRGLRRTLVAECAVVGIVDLHGDSNVGEEIPEGRANENVFDIMQGVAITVLARTPRGGTTSVFHQDAWGTREEKYTLLRGHPTITTGPRLEVSEPYFFFTRKDLTSGAEQAAWVSIQQLFGVAGMGVKSRRDEFLIDQRREVLHERFARLAAAPDVESLRAEFGVSDNAQWSLKSLQALVRHEGVDTCIFPILYRPFDTRYIWYHKDAIERGDARWAVMKHTLSGGISILAARQSTNAQFTSVFVAQGLSEMKAAESSRGSYAFPVNLDSGQIALGRFSGESNIKSSLLGATLRRRSPDDISHYIYAILHSPSYRTRYAGSLAIEFPKVPRECSAALMPGLCKLGSELMALHTLESPILARAPSRFTGPRDDLRVETVSYERDTVWIDNARTRGFRDVPVDVWKFEIGGYQVCEKWLRSRKGCPLSSRDLEHYGRILLALSETVRLMREIDELIDAHGGWPDAFVGVHAPREPSEPGQLPVAERSRSGPIG